MRRYTLLPSAQGPLEGLTLLERALLGLVGDRLKLSLKPRNSARFQADALVDGPEGYYCVYGAAELAAELGVSERTVRRALVSLDERGKIFVGRDGFQGRYRLMLPLDVIQWLGLDRQHAQYT